MTGPGLLLALTAGMVAAINPCGFSLLPAYVGFFVTGDGAEVSLERRVSRAVSSSASVTLGFVIVFVLLGVVLSSVADRVRGQLPWVTIVVGSVLVVAGVATVMGRRLPMPSIALRASKGRGLTAMVSYGAVYALASLSCTIGPFLAITTSAIRQSLIGGIEAYVAYAFGMGAIILAIAFSAALAQPRPVSELRRLSRFAPRFGGVLMVVSGSYAIWYARWELAVYRGDLAHDPVVDAGERWRLAAVGWVERIGPIELSLAIVGAVALTVLIAGLRADRRLSSGNDSAEP